MEAKLVELQQNGGKEKAVFLLPTHYNPHHYRLSRIAAEWFCFRYEKTQLFSLLEKALGIGCYNARQFLELLTKIGVPVSTLGGSLERSLVEAAKNERVEYEVREPIPPDLFRKVELVMEDEIGDEDCRGWTLESRIVEGKYKGRDDEVFTYDITRKYSVFVTEAEKKILKSALKEFARATKQAVIYLEFQLNVKVDLQSPDGERSSKEDN